MRIKRTWRQIFTAASLCSIVIAVVIAGESRVDEPLRPLPLVLDLDQRKVELGSRLYNEARLSFDNTLSCTSCHNLKTNGSDHRRFFVGVGGLAGNIRTPTVYNSSYNFVQFWDGRATTLEDQIGNCINTKFTTETGWGQVVVRLQRDTELTAAFLAIYKSGLTRVNIIDAITTFERSLVTSGSPFDEWLRGSDTAINEDELEGYKLFKSYGCVSCHQGINVGGNMFGKMGAVKDYFNDRAGNISSVDIGRQNITNNDEDRFLFKVPGLRLASLNKYFFHDASADNMEDAIRVMAQYQLGRDMPDADVNRIAAFLNSLKGNHPRMQK